MSYKSVAQGCTARVADKSVPQECLTRVSCKGVPQSDKSHKSVRHVWAFVFKYALAFGFVGSILFFVSSVLSDLTRNSVLTAFILPADSLKQTRCLFSKGGRSLVSESSTEVIPPQKGPESPKRR